MAHLPVAGKATSANPRPAALTGHRLGTESTNTAALTTPAAAKADVSHNPDAA
jgi:hypothetical protein